MIKGLDNNYHSVALTSDLYDVVGVYPGNAKCAGPDITQMPTLINITIKKDAGQRGPRGVNIKGELAVQFTKELINLRSYLRGNEGGNFDEWRWHESFIYPFLHDWVAKMDSIKLALKVMDVTRQGNRATFNDWFADTAARGVSIPFKSYSGR